jgi:hypothetical protein
MTAVTTEYVAGLMILLNKVRGELKEKQEEEEEIIKHLSASIIFLPSSEKSNFPVCKNFITSII